MSAAVADAIETLAEAPGTLTGMAIWLRGDTTLAARADEDRATDLALADRYEAYAHAVRELLTDVPALRARLAAYEAAWRTAEQALEQIAYTGSDVAPGMSPEAQYRNATWASIGTAARGLRTARAALAATT